MCTAITYKTMSAYFGRTLDVECSYGEEVIVTPRNFALDFRYTAAQNSHYAMIGMGIVKDGYPLYFDAANEHGLAMAGLRFANNAYYFDLQEGKENIASFELVLWLLGSCRNLHDVRQKMQSLNICNTPFSSTFPTAPLHWMVTDGEKSLVIESSADGLHIYPNPVGVLTNNPPFFYHMWHLCDYMALSKDAPVAHLGKDFLAPYSRGMGALGLPGDFSSASRFVRAAFVRENAVSNGDETASVSQFFHILGSVEQIRGCVRLPDGSLEATAYTSCINLERSIYYYTTYQNRTISAVDLRKCDLEGVELCRFSLRTEQKIVWQN